MRCFYRTILIHSSHTSIPKIQDLFKSEKEELAYISLLIDQFLESNYNSLGIICKTQQQADVLHTALKSTYQISLLNALSIAFGNGIVITTAHLAKGLEFDCVVVPFATHKNYVTEPDRQMLYVACTRAMHCLSLTGTGAVTCFLD